MAIDPEALAALHASETIEYDERDVMLYALSTGMGHDPLDPAELPFVYERELRPLPSMAAVFGGRNSATLLAGAPLTQHLALHGEQRLQMHRPWPPAAALRAQSRVSGLYDKGLQKGALVLVETELTERDTGTAIATLGITVFARGDGGFGGPSAGAPEPSVMPDGPPDVAFDRPTRPDQALLYRLNGDLNPIHADPAISRQAGFDRPILHGLCTYGIACGAVVRTVAGDDPARIARLDVRFSAPVLPGETIRTEIWRSADGAYAFQCRAVERDLVVLRNGVATLVSDR